MGIRKEGMEVDDFDAEARARGRAVAKRTFWGMMLIGSLLLTLGIILDNMLVVGIMLVGFSYPLLKVLREYRNPDEFTKPRYWGVVADVLERHGNPQAAHAGDAPGGESPAERRVRIQDEMDRIRRLGPKPRSRGDGSLVPPALLTLVTATAGVLYLTLGHNRAAGIAWLGMSGVVAGLGWLRRAMRKKERRALSLLQEELEELERSRRLDGGSPDAPRRRRGVILRGEAET